MNQQIEVIWDIQVILEIQSFESDLSSGIVVIQVIWEFLVIWVIWSDIELVDHQVNFGHLGNFGNFDRCGII